MPLLARPSIRASLFFLPLSVLLLLLAVPAAASPTLPSLTTRSRTCPVKLPEDEPTPDISVPSASRNSSADDRIVNGDIIAPGLAPYLVAIYHSDGRFKCTGTLVSSTWVISAAHCKTSSFDFVRLAVTKTDQGADPHFINDVTIHTSYDGDTGPGKRFDIVAIELAEPAPSGTKFMKVNVNTAIPASGSFVRVAGYGDTESAANESSNVKGRLRQVDVPVTKNSQCTDAYALVDTNAQVCAGYLGSGGCDSCQGDSGGPMIQYTESGEPILVGIVSSGAGCASRNFPGIYVRTAAFGTWMERDTSMVFTTATSTKAVFDSGISTGAIVGIVICGLIVVLAVVAITIVVRRRRAGTASDTAPNAAAGNSGPGGMAAGVGAGYAGMAATDGGVGLGQQQSVAGYGYVPAPPAVAQAQVAYMAPTPAGYTGQAPPPPPPLAAAQPGQAGQYVLQQEQQQQGQSVGYVAGPQAAVYATGYGSGQMMHGDSRGIGGETVESVGTSGQAGMGADEISAGAADKGNEGASGASMYT